MAHSLSDEEWINYHLQIENENEDEGENNYCEICGDQEPCCCDLANDRFDNFLKDECCLWNSSDEEREQRGLDFYHQYCDYEYYENYPLNNNNDGVVNRNILINNSASRPKPSCPLAIFTECATCGVQCSTQPDSNHKKYIPCDNAFCAWDMCKGCWKKHLSMNVGEIIEDRRRKCPGCQKMLGKRFTDEINPTLSLISGQEFDDDWWFAICIQCRCAKRHSIKKCGDEIGRVTDFICHQCIPCPMAAGSSSSSSSSVVSPCESCEYERQIERIRLLRRLRRAEAEALYAHRRAIECHVVERKEKNVDCTKDCPNCSVAITKIGGCNHIECTSCGTHFCFECLTSCEDRDATYAHMRKFGHTFVY